MTENEAIEWLAEETSPKLIHIAEMKKENPMEYINEAVKVACHALEEVQQYRAIGTIEQLKTMSDDFWELNEMCKTYSEIGTIEEFKDLKEKNTEILLKDGQLLYQQGLLDGYIKAINEFAERLKTDYVNFDMYYILQNNNFAFENTSLKSYQNMIDEIAKEMKGGAE